jgi:hypothetical protein
MAHLAFQEELDGVQAEWFEKIGDHFCNATPAIAWKCRVAGPPLTMQCH